MTKAGTTAGVAIRGRNSLTGARACTRRKSRVAGGGSKLDGPVLLKALYWAAVVAISLALLVGLILFFESRDESTLDESNASTRNGALELAAVR